MIKVENVTKKFGEGTVAVSDINLEIPAQDFVFVVGPSGAGKTTLLRLLIRELSPSEGKITVDPQDRAVRLHYFRRHVFALWRRGDAVGGGRRRRLPVCG